MTLAGVILKPIIPMDLFWGGGGGELNRLIVLDSSGTTAGLPALADEEEHDQRG